MGSNLASEAPYIEALKKIMGILNTHKKLAKSIDYIDIGGGFPAELSKTMKIASELGKWIKRNFLSVFPSLSIIFEPGRFLVAEAGVLLTRVNYVKEMYGREWVLVDAGMNDFIRPMLYRARHNLKCITCKTHVLRRYSIGGPICESSDVLANNVYLPVLSRGDLLVIMMAGAYGYSMASNYNQRPKPAVVKVQQSKPILIRRREAIAEII